MRELDWSKAMDGSLVLLTAEDSIEGARMLMADFRDTHGLFYSRFNRWMGASRDGRVRFGKSPPRLVDGIWYVDEDTELNGENPDHRPDVSLVVLKVIAWP